MIPGPDETDWAWFFGCRNCNGRFICPEAYTAKSMLCGHYDGWIINPSKEKQG